LHTRVEFIGRHLDAVLVLLNPDIGLGECFHDLVELLCGQRQRATLGNRSIATASKRNFKIGCEHANFVTLGLNQDVCQDWNRVLALYDALEKLQFSQKLVLPDHEFHRLTVTSERGGMPAIYGASIRFL